MTTLQHMELTVTVARNCTTLILLCLCVLVVYTFNDFVMIEINRDENFILEMTAKLDEFFNDHFKQAVLNKFYYKHYCDYSFTACK